MAEGGDPAVHHVAGRNEICPGLGVRDRAAGQELEGGIVQDLPLPDDAAVAVVGVLAKADVGDDQEVLPQRPLDFPHSLLNDSGLVIGAVAQGVLLLRDAEEDHPGNPQRGDLLALPREPVYRPVIVARHRADLAAGVLLVRHEQRVDEVRRGKLRLTHHAAQQLGPAQAARAAFRKGQTLKEGGRFGHALSPVGVSDGAAPTG